MAHYYKSTGELVSHVPYADGRPGERECTLADARKQLLFPSVTTVLSLLAKPQLTDWMVEQGILTAWQLAPTDIKAVKQAAFQQVSDAAAFGTEVHRGISMGLAGETYWPTDLRVKLVLDGFWPWFMASGIKVEQAEQSFVNEEHGYAGTIDWQGTYLGRPAMGDWKTQEFETEGAANFYDPEHPLQLAGYDMDRGRSRVSVVISRTKPGCVSLKTWLDNPRYDRMFLNLLAFWRDAKSYDPRLPVNVIRLARVETGESE